MTPWRRRSADATAADVERRLVWVFGSPRTGTTWLLNLVAAHPEVAAMDEPGIGMHLALFAPDTLGVPARGFDAEQMRVNDSRAKDDDYFFADSYADVWRSSVRSLLLDRFAAHVERQAPEAKRLMVKEPNGSLAADLIMSALPAARLLWVLRDGRDVVDSQLDAARKGSWLSNFGGGMEGDPAERLRFLEDRAHLWVARTRAVQRAYAGHDAALRHTVRYEELLADTAPLLRGLYGWLDITAPDDLDDIVARRSFAALPEAARGPGQFARAASPGLWRDNLTGDEQAVVNAVMGPMLDELGYSLG